MASRTILVTGGNRGIGLSIVQRLAQSSPKDQIVLTSRTTASATAAIDHLRKLNLGANVSSLELDVTDDQSIESAAATMRDRFGKVDVLVNNAGIARRPKGPLADQRDAYNTIFNTNITSVANMSTAFLPLLTEGKGTSATDTAVENGNNSARNYTPRIINISSSRGSLALSTTDAMPPTLVIPYSVSKTALNALTVEFQKTYPDMLFYAANPGHCKTEFNGFRGARDPLEGANVVAELVNGRHEGRGGDHEWGFWETKGEEREAVKVPW